MMIVVLSLEDSDKRLPNAMTSVYAAQVVNTPCADGRTAVIRQ